MKEDREPAALSFEKRKKKKKKKEKGKVMAEGRQAQQLRAERGRSICCWREAMEGWQGQREEAARERGEEDGKRREARYLLPCLSESKRCQKVENGGGRNTERQKEGR